MWVYMYIYICNLYNIWLSYIKINSKHLCRTEIICSQSKEDGVLWVAAALSTGGAVAVAQGLWAGPQARCCRLWFPVLVCCGRSWGWVWTTAELSPWSGSPPEPRGITDKAGWAPLGHHPPQEGISVLTPLSGCLPRDVKRSFVWFRTAEHRGISLWSSQEHFVGLLKSLCIGSLIYILFSSKTLILS